ncbi:MAG: PEP-CTERM sorting domain-containing protein [Verrucomicrobiota bacterium]|jgi:hypothetical protein
MKKILLAGLFSAMAIGAYAQGTVVFSDRISGALVFHIYAPQQSGLEVQGASSLDTPSGTTVYDANSLLGGASGAAVGLTGPFTAGSAVYGYGNQFTVALYADAGAGDALSALSLMTQYEGVMRQTSSSAVLGTFIPNAISGTDPGIPNTPVASPIATVAVAAWYNDGGTITTLAQAEADGVPYGESLPVTITGLGESGASPPVTAPNLVGVQSFSLVTVPEPSTIALGLMGVCGFLARRRMK